MLTDDQRRRQGRQIALRQIGEAGQQLVEQLPQTEGAAQLGIIQAIGQRREVAAVDELLKMQASENDGPCLPWQISRRAPTSTGTTTSQNGAVKARKKSSWGRRGQESRSR